MSENLRKKVHELLVRTMNELKEMYDAVNLSMNRRVMETSDAKKNLKNHSKRVSALTRKANISPQHNYNQPVHKRWLHVHFAIILCEQKTLKVEQNVKRKCCHDTKIDRKEAVTCSYKLVVVLSLAQHISKTTVESKRGRLRDFAVRNLQL